jgi:uncharacterized protein (UPF0333 family)
MRARAMKKQVKLNHFRFEALFMLSAPVALIVIGIATAYFLG